MKMRCWSLSRPPAFVREVVGDGDPLVLVVVVEVRVHATATMLLATSASAARRRNMGAESIRGLSPDRRPPRPSRGAAAVPGRALPGGAGVFDTMPDHGPPLRRRRDRAAMGRSMGSRGLVPRRRR